MKKGLMMLLVLSIVCSCFGAMAMPIRYSEGAAELTGVNVADGAEATFTAQALQLLGMDPEGSYLVYANQNYYKVTPENMAGVLELLDPITTSGLRSVEGRQPIGKGNKGDEAMQLQQALIALGYLEGAADGDFGGKSESAVKAFQAAHGMAETGIADENLRLLILSMADVEQVVAPLPTEAKFEAISDRVSVDLTPVYASDLILEYDDMTGRGFITNGESYLFDLSGEADLDKYQLTIRFGLLVRDQADGTTSVEPAAEVKCLCTRRPVLTSVIMKAGAHRGTAPLTELDTELEGVSAIETGCAILDSGMISALAGAAEAGELKLRIEGKYKTFDVALAPEQLAGAAKVGAVASQIFG